MLDDSSRARARACARARGVVTPERFYERVERSLAYIRLNFSREHAFDDTRSLQSEGLQVESSDTTSFTDAAASIEFTRSFTEIQVNRYDIDVGCFI